MVELEVKEHSWDLLGYKLLLPTLYNLQLSAKQTNTTFLQLHICLHV